MRIVKPGLVMVKAQFVVMDEDGNVIGSKTGPEAVLHFPHAARLSEYLEEQVKRIEGEDG